MVIVSPLSRATWDPFQMAFSQLITGGDPKYLQVLEWSSKLGSQDGRYQNAGRFPVSTIQAATVPMEVEGDEVLLKTNGWNLNISPKENGETFTNPRSPQMVV